VPFKRSWAVLAVFLFFFGLIACGDDESTETILVFAAASLTDAFGDIESAFEAANPDLDVQLNFAGSSVLREQILEGAPADVFASASESNMADAADADALSGQAQTFAENTLEIAVPSGNPGAVRGIEDFANDDLSIGLCAEGVPCGDLAREALTNAGVEPSIDTNEPDVRSLLTKIRADELDAGIVYVTDVSAVGYAVEGIGVPEADNVVARYPIARLAESPNPVGASAFMDFVLSGEGQGILFDYGFASP
jgi:molybdate transport system substrate-binding protein